MAGFCDDLEVVENPNNDELVEFVKIHGKIKVGEAKDAGIIASGAEIGKAYKYAKSLEPTISTGMITLATEIAVQEFISSTPENFTSNAMDLGNELEGHAVDLLSDRIGKKIDNVGDHQSFFHRGALSATPDGCVYSGFDIMELAEVKCLQITSHSKFLSLVKDQDDLLAHFPEYYWQTQCQLAVTGAKLVHFQSYSPYFSNGYNLVYIEVKPNLEHIDILNSRAETVLELVPGIRQQIIDNPARVWIEHELNN